MNIKLDKFDSQLVYISKGWAEKFDKNYDYLKCVRNIWSHRCGIEEKHVQNGFVAGHMLDLIKTVNGKKPLSSIVADLAPQSMYSTVPSYTDNAGFSVHIIWVVLYKNFCSLQIKNDEEILIGLEPFDADLISKGYYEDEAKEREAALLAQKE